MPEINTGGENREYGLGCLPFIVFIILFMVAVILILLFILNLDIRIFDTAMPDIEDLYHFYINSNDSSVFASCRC